MEGLLDLAGGGVMLTPVSASKREWTSFVVSVTLVVALLASIFFTAFYLNNTWALESEVKDRAQALFSSIVLSRKWNALHGGVYVEKRSGVESNPYLEDPDIRSVDGKVYTMKNPALMTREISELAKQEGLFSFKITSLQLVNPANQPDQFERNALLSFEQGVKEAEVTETRNGAAVYRFMAPVYVEESCLSCHSNMGYKVGDIRGGISVSFDITDVTESVTRSRFLTVALFLITLSAFWLVLRRLVGALQGKLSAAQETISQMAITDELTGMHNRRYVMEQLNKEHARAMRFHRPLSCILLDVDHFKQVNDEHGHGAGDSVLKALASSLAVRCRTQDALGRFGGEEFLIILPEADRQVATTVAERLRLALEELEVEDGEGGRISVTASFGVSTMEPYGSAPLSAEEIVKRADKALYKAKELGRNRVEVADTR